MVVKSGRVKLLAEKKRAARDTLVGKLSSVRLPACLWYLNLATRSRSPLNVCAPASPLMPLKSSNTPCKNQSLPSFLDLARLRTGRNTLCNYYHLCVYDRPLLQLYLLSHLATKWNESTHKETCKFRLVSSLTIFYITTSMLLRARVFLFVSLSAALSISIRFWSCSLYLSTSLTDSRCSMTDSESSARWALHHKRAKSDLSLVVALLHVTLAWFCPTSGREELWALIWFTRQQLSLSPCLCNLQFAQLKTTCNTGERAESDASLPLFFELDAMLAADKEASAIWREPRLLQTNRIMFAKIK